MKSKTSILFVAAILAVLCAMSPIAHGKENKQKKGKTDTQQQSGPNPSAKIDLNTASQKDLEDLPGVGPVTAKKIIANRPYASVSDLSKAGVSQKTITKISPMVTVGAASTGAGPTSSSSTSAPPKKSSSGAADQKNTGTSASTQSITAGENDPNTKVWVNKDSKVYHLPGDRWYGKTKNGEYMTLAEAQKAGYRASRQHSKKE